MKFSVAMQTEIVMPYTVEDIYQISQIVAIASIKVWVKESMYNAV